MVYSLTDIDFEQTINRPRRKFGKKSLADLKKYAKANNLRLIDALGEQIRNGTIKKEALKEYYWSIVNLHNKYKEYSSKELVNKVLDIGYRQELQEDVDQTKIDNVTELITTISELEKENEENIPLDELLSHFALFSNQDDDSDKTDVVKVMTIHTAKGLEFDTVFIPGLVEGQFPSSRLRNYDEMEEERRLFYVAITRAKRNLYLSGYCSKPGQYLCEHSRFIDNINSDLIQFVNRTIQRNEYKNDAMLPKQIYQVGDRIRHKVFGIGEIISINEREQFYNIKFETVEVERKIQFRALLERV